MIYLWNVILFVCLVNLLAIQLVTSTDKPLDVSPEEIEDAFENAYDDVKYLRSLESILPNIGGILPTNVPSPEVRHYGDGGSKRSLEVNDIYYVFQQATKFLRDEFGLSRDEVRTRLSKVDLSKGGKKTQSALATCRALFDVRKCDPHSPYRTVNGSCNNLKNPNWGMTTSCLDRILPAYYDDGVESPRVSYVGGDLPNPRNLSTAIHSELNIDSKDFTLMIMQFGQFLDHDVTLSPMIKTTKSMEPIDCCPIGKNPHPDCIPIPISRKDQFFGPLMRTCISMVRSSGCNSDCTLGPRSQVNFLTSFIDASNMYGHDEEEMASLREHSGGRLLVTPNGLTGDLLPQVNVSQNHQCTRGTAEHKCFVSGDERANEQPGLTSMHTVWLRQHNRIASELRRLNPKLLDEEVFQKTRRILGAQMQHVTYTEFLPQVIGDKARSDYCLYSAYPGRTVYDPSCRPHILVEFSTAAYRFGHTLIQNAFSLKPTKGSNSTSEVDLSQNYFNEEPVLSGLIPGLMGGMAGPAQEFDRHVVDAVTKHLYKVSGTKSGLDLVAINIQRGRDHGLRTYNQYVEKCGLGTIRNFDDLTWLMENKTVDKLRDNYKSVYDIDLFTGGLCEKQVKGAVVGPTFACIIGQQFKRLRCGDRFYYENGDYNGAAFFTDDQLREIRKTTLAKVVCDNTGLQDIQENVFKRRSPVKKCSDLESLNYRVFINS